MSLFRGREKKHGGRGKATGKVVSQKEKILTSRRQGANVDDDSAQGGLGKQTIYKKLAQEEKCAAFPPKAGGEGRTAKEYSVAFASAAEKERVLETGERRPSGRKGRTPKEKTHKGGARTNNNRKMPQL